MTQPAPRDWPGWLFIPLLWAGLFALGFPFPITDDLWYIGAALQLNETGHYANPYCRILETFGAMDPFYAYPPLHSFVLAGWLKVLGVSRVSLELFQCTAGAMASLLLWRLVRRGGALLVPIGVGITTATLLSGLGLRPDALGLSLLGGGALIMRFPSRLAWAVCGVPLFLAVITSPNFVVLLPIIVGAAIYFQLWLRQAPPAEYVIRAAILLVCGAAVFLLLLKLIDFQLGSFLTAMNVNRAKSSQYAMIGEFHSLTNWRDDLRFVAHAIEPVVLLGGVLALAWLRPRWMQRPLGPAILTVIGLAGLALLGPALNSAGGTRDPAFFATLVALVYVAELRAPVRYFGFAAWGGMYLLFLFAIGRLLLDLAASKTACIPPAETILRRLNALNPTAIYIDEFALNAVYHYHLPARVYDYHFSLTKLDSSANPVEYPPGSVLIISTQEVAFMKKPGASIPFDRIHNPVLRRGYFYMMEDPYDFVIFHVGEGGQIDLR
jgi:hypothetical protein